MIETIFYQYTGLVGRPGEMVIIERRGEYHSKYFEVTEGFFPGTYDASRLTSSEVEQVMVHLMELDEEDVEITWSEPEVLAMLRAVENIEAGNHSWSR